MHVKIVGHSHTNALRAALQAEPFPYHVDILHLLMEVSNRQCCVVEEGRTQLDPALRRKLQAQGDGDEIVFSQVGGNVHSYLGMFRHPEPFDFILPGRAGRSATRGARNLTLAYVSEVLRGMLKLDFDVLAALRNTTRAPVHHLESPPPISDGAYCRELLPQAFRDSFQNREIADAAFRSRIWRLHGDLIAAECSRLGIGFVPCPAEAVNQGFLRREYWADPLHGNARYGRLVLDQIASMAAAARSKE